VFREIRARLTDVIGPILGIAAVFYFAYHVVEGDRGLVSWWQVKHEITTAAAIMDDVTLERRKIEHRVQLLQSGSIDPDLLDERARVMLNYGRTDEIVILTSKGS
jgi:cell division protein FtsB